MGLINTLRLIGGFEPSVNRTVKENIIPWRLGFDDFPRFFFGAGGHSLAVDFRLTPSFFEIGLTGFKLVSSFFGAVNIAFAGFSGLLVVAVPTLVSDDEVEGSMRSDVFGVVELDEAVEVRVRVGFIRFFMGNKEVEDIITEKVFEKVEERLKVLKRTLGICQKEVFGSQTESVPWHFDELRFNITRSSGHWDTDIIINSREGERVGWER